MTYWWSPATGGSQDHRADLATRWECALQCSCIWTALVAAFLIISSHTYLALERTFGLSTFFLMWLGNL